MQEEQKGTIDGELTTVIASIALACKQIASLVNRAGISNLTGVDGGQNVQASAYALAHGLHWRAPASTRRAHPHAARTLRAQQGEDQKKLDVISNEVFCNCLRASGRTVSEGAACAWRCPHCSHGLPVGVLAHPMWLAQGQWQLSSACVST